MCVRMSYNNCNDQERLVAKWTAQLSIAVKIERTERSRAEAVIHRSEAKEKYDQNESLSMTFEWSNFLLLKIIIHIEPHQLKFNFNQANVRRIGANTFCSNMKINVLRKWGGLAEKSEFYGNENAESSCSNFDPNK